MFEDIIDERKSRRNFYRDYYRKMSRLLYLTLIIIMVEIALIVLVFFTQETPEFYASSSDGNLGQISPAPFGSHLKDPSPDLLPENNVSSQGINNG